jgi:nocardicin N-oxygenase
MSSTIEPFPTVTRPQLRHDPALDRWRVEEPVRRIQMPHGRWCWVVTRNADVREVMTDPRFSRRAAAADDAPRRTPGVVQRGSLASMDGADHSRLRRLLSRALTVRHMEALRPRTVELVTGFLDALEATGPDAELVHGLCRPVPISVICELLDVPAEDRDRFEHWAALVLSTRPPQEGESDDTSVAVAALWAYLGELIAARRREPGDDLLTRLVEARDEGDALTEDEMVWLSFTMLAGGFETVSQLIAKSIVVLLQHPTQLATVQADPELWTSAVEELLRFIALGPGTSLPLEALEDVELSGVRISAGDYVLTAPAAANFDTDAFDDPERLDLTRADNLHLGLGHGAHYCLGANLAKMEMQVTLRLLFERFPELHLAVAVDDLPWVPNHAVWGLADLPVRLRPGA